MRILRLPSPLLPDVALDAVHFSDPWAALDQIATATPDAIVIDLAADLPITPERLLEEIRRRSQHTAVLFRLPAAHFGLDSLLDLTARLTRLGAHAIVPDAAPAERVLAVLQSCLKPVDSPDNPEPWRDALVGHSAAMERVADMIRLVGPRRATILITGESGTGKERAAQAVHLASPRAHGPFVAVNCGAIPENLLEAELFGHVKGAYTGAHTARVGRFEQAQQGTLFLDEIGDLPLDLQTKLLRALQEREIQRLGSGETIKVDVRVVAATNACLPDRIREGRFREDLYYRLNVVPLELPPLRARQGDIPLLVDHFMEKICRQEDLPPKHVPRETLDRLARYDWPGNVRQLENAVEMAVALSGERRDLLPSDFPLPALERTPAPLAAHPPAVMIPENGIDYEQVVGSFEMQILSQALRRTNGNKSHAAEILRLKRTTLAAKLKALEATVGRAS